MGKILSKHWELVEKIGFWSVVFSVLLISLQRNLALIGIGIALMTGLLNAFFHPLDYFKVLRDRWKLIFPPVVYFVLILASIILQNGNFRELEIYILFLLLPLLGYPFFLTGYFSRNVEYIYKFFIAGLLLTTMILIVRIGIIIYTSVPEGQDILEYFTRNNEDFVSWRFSIFEHPSYLSLKLVFAFVLLYIFEEEWGVGSVILWGIYFIFSLSIFLLASKAGIVSWLLTSVIIVFYSLKKLKNWKVSLLIIVPLVSVMTLFSLKKLDRVSYFIVYTGRGLDQKGFDWKNLDQRTRNWYAATEMIKEKPVLGHGIKEKKKRISQIYAKNGFSEEAELSMNAHNQLLESQMMFGLTGSLIFIWMIINTLKARQGNRYRNLVIPFILIFLFFSTFESLLERLSGIYFFLIFSFLFLSTQEPKGKVS